MGCQTGRNNAPARGGVNRALKANEEGPVSAGPLLFGTLGQRGVIGLDLRDFLLCNLGIARAGFRLGVQFTGTRCVLQNRLDREVIRADMTQTSDANQREIG